MATGNAKPPAPKGGKTTPAPPLNTNKAAAKVASESMLRPGRKVKVRATRMGYYDHVRRRVDDVFLYTITDYEAKKGLPTWVEAVDAKTPERVTTGVQALREEHDRILAERNPARGTPSTSLDDETNPLDA